MGNPTARGGIKPFGAGSAGEYLMPFAHGATNNFNEMIMEVIGAIRY